MRHAAVRRRRDSNEPQIIAALRAVGATVVQLGGTDQPDLLVGFARRTWIAEVKTATGKLKPGQRRWAETWRGSDVYLLRSPEDALEMIGIAARSKAV
jgi:hypothetical protein